MREFKVIKNFFKIQKANQMARLMEELYFKDTYRAPDSICQLSPAFYGIFNDEMAEALGQIEEIVDLKLYPVYTYARLYQENEYMRPHVDREGAEISISITLDYDKSPWPIYILDSNKQVNEIILDKGDAVVYKGQDLVHFRHPMVHQKYQHQAFFHYVNQQGSFANQKYDKHSKLLTSEEAKSLNFPDWTDEKYKQGKIKINSFN